ncbi:MAG: hypothetical protein INR70_19610 [Parafilimonas terrae]|nr:hypothetical protein [Parafilimonas terrae]
MDHVPSMAAVSAAHKSDAGEVILPAVINAVAPSAPAALDPRSIYTLSAEAADAVLSLAQQKVQALQVADVNSRYEVGPRAVAAVTAAAVVAAPVVTPESSKSTAVAQRNWTEDARLEPVPTRQIGADLAVQYDNPRVMAAWSAAFPDIANRKFRGLQLSDTHVKSALAKAAEVAGVDGHSKDIYLLCNGEKFKIFSEDHPDTKINWIDIDDDQILVFWPKGEGSQ